MNDIALLLLRIGLASIFLTHGWHKRRLWKMQPSQQMPAQMLYTLRFLSIAEPSGGLGVLFGFLTRFAAIGLALVMLGAINFLITKVHRRFTGENVAGWEFEYLVLIVAIVLALTGGGKYALDRVAFGW